MNKKEKKKSYCQEMRIIKRISWEWGKVFNWTYQRYENRYEPLTNKQGPPQCHNNVTVWFAMKPASAFLLYVFLFFFLFFFFKPVIVDFVNCEQCIHALFTVPQITLFSNFFFKNGSHNTIYTFKNYFATVFSVLAKISSIQTHPIGRSGC